MRKKRVLRKIRAALYARVSTVNGTVKGREEDPELQLREQREFSQLRKWEIVDSYVDRGVSGAKDSRPELNRLMADARRRKFDVVLVWKFDRFARSTSHLLWALEEFKVLGIDFVSLTEGVDTTTPMGKMVFTVLGAVAELERSLIVARIKAGIRNAKGKGHRPGRKRFDLDMPAIESRIDAGESLTAVARSLSVSPALLSKRLKGQS